MLQAIALLGKALPQDPLKDIVDRTNAKDIFVIKLDKNCKYAGLTVENNEGEDKYLYKRERGGLPGKFITGRIGSIDIKNLKKNLQQILSQSSDKSDVLSYAIDRFKKNKIAWIKKSGILKNIDAMKRIPSDSVNMLNFIIDEIISQQDKIMKHLSEKILNGEYGDILLTVKIDTKYLSDIEGFSDLLRIASQGEEPMPSSELGYLTLSRCMVCGEKASISELKEPLPFFTIDKPNFIPDGIYINSKKAFSLCRTCYLDVQRGSRYIQDKLCFDIPNTSGHSRLWFWLVPQLNDLTILQDNYITKSEKGLASFKYMSSISKGMDFVKEADLGSILEESNDIKDNLLTYVALFHYYDPQKHMRLIAAVDGIYPSRFKELWKEKYIVDKIAFKTNNPNKFYFGLITDFLEKGSEGWMKTMAYIMSCIFTKKRMEETLVVKLLLAPSKSALSKRQLKESHQILLKATLIFEYLYRVNTLLSPSHDIGSDPSPANEITSMAARFLNSHSGILYTKNLRAICAIGISVGVIIKVQQRFLGSDSFISRLNRLEMDYPRLLSLYPQSLIKLKHYKADAKYSDVFTYLGNNEISNLDPKQQVQKELMNLIFAIGMAHGFTLGEKE